ncbi:MAG TPA: TIGR03621 family F420-dependent LLM class oxidoreductase [Ktedonobacteraceae bacterium]|jgi:probable F420-dependent oxidoreductase|nr:TIGR03621 family F420-dependent LLM class oxidoreductase [Ktedonobacteraceae bacterium]
MAKAFRFGVVSAGKPSGAEWITLAQRAEALGYSSLLMPDRTVTPFAVVPALAAAATATKTLHVGSYVFCNGLHQPALLARDLATLDLLSNGRVEIGLGAGVAESDFQQVGLPFGSAGERVSQLEEALHVIKQFFTDRMVNFSGKYYTIQDLPAMPRAVQQPHPPIFIGSAGRRLLSIAAREADIIAPTLGWGEAVDEEKLLEKINWIRAAAGERFEQIEFSQTNFNIVLTDGPAEVSFLRGGPPVQPSSMSSEQAIEYLLRKREKLGFSYIQVQEGQLENFAPVVARLNGQ